MTTRLTRGLRRCAAGLMTLGLLAGASHAAACRRKAHAQSEAQTGKGLSESDPAILDGSERVAWDQAGASLEQVRGFRYMAVVGQMARDIEDVRCEGKAPTGPFVCSGKLPLIQPGLHRLRLIAVAKDGPKNLISRWSEPIVVEKK